MSAEPLLGLSQWPFWNFVDLSCWIEYPEEVLRDVRESKNKEIIAVVEELLKRGNKRTCKEKESRPDVERRWWQLRDVKLIIRGHYGTNKGLFNNHRHCMPEFLGGCSVPMFRGI